MRPERVGLNLTIPGFRAAKVHGLQMPRLVAIALRDCALTSRCVYGSRTWPSANRGMGVDMAPRYPRIERRLEIVIRRQRRGFAQQRNGDAPVARQRRIVGKHGLRIGATSDLVDAIGRNALRHQHSAGRVSACS